jgi:hypothetical protein
MEQPGVQSATEGQLYMLQGGLAPMGSPRRPVQRPPRRELIAMGWKTPVFPPEGCAVSKLTGVKMDTWKLSFVVCQKRQVVGL